MTALLARCEEAGVRAVYDSAAEALIRDGSGRIVGVVVREAGVTRHLLARRGVVLSTGGFGWNPELVARYFPDLPETAEPLGTPYTDGSGVLLGVAAGAATRGMDGLIATASFYPPGQLIKGIVVNRLGRRFVAEDSYHGRTAAFVAEQPGRRAFLIVDSEIFAYPKIAIHNHRLVDGFETIEEMEAGLELPEGSLRETMRRYDEDAARGVDTEFFKHPDWLQPLNR